MLRFRAFGAIDLHREGGERLEDLLSQPKRLSLLAYLAERQPSGPVRREQILSLLWPESAPSSGRHALSSSLSRLRRTLGEEVLRGSGEETLWLSRDEFRSDVADYREAIEAGRPRDALDLYRGPFLEGLRPPDARPFEEWVEERREAYRRGAYEAGLEAGEAALGRGDPGAAEHCFRRSHGIEPLRQEAAEGLMRVLAERGKRSDALQFYETFRQRLADELDVAPSGELRERAAELRSDRDSVPRDVAGRSTGSGAGASASGGRPERAEGRTSRPGSPGASPRPRTLAAGLLVVLALVAGGLWAWDALGPSSSGGQASTPDRAGETIPTVAVLPFEDLSDRQGQNRLLRGLRADLLTRLSGVSGLRVKSGTSTDRYRGADLALPAIADSLDARWVLEGGVNQVGDTVQVHAQLIDSETDTHLWAETYRRDRTSQHLFGLQRDLTRRIADALEVRLTTEEELRAAAPPTESAAAYELYLQARGITYGEADAEEEANLAVQLFRRALALDSTFAEAWAGLADAYADRIWDFGYPVSWADSGVVAARKAIRYDPELASAYTQLGDNLGILGRRQARMDAYREALRRDPGHGQTLGNLVTVLTTTGRVAEAVQWLDRAYRASPDSDRIVGMLASSNAWLGRLEVAEAWMEHAREQGYETLGWRWAVTLFVRNDPAGATALLDRLRKRKEREYPERRAYIAVYERDWDEALRRYRKFAGARPLTAGRKLPTLAPGPTLATALSRLERVQDARSTARKTLEAIDRASTGFGGAARTDRRVMEAVSHLVLGDTARALEELSEAVDLGYRNLPDLRYAPALDPLRDHPRFREIVGRVDSLVTDAREEVEEEGWGEPPERLLERS